MIYLPLTRFQAELLADLLDDADCAGDGKWRDEISVPLRNLIGTDCSVAKSKFISERCDVCGHFEMKEEDAFVGMWPENPVRGTKILTCVGCGCQKLNYESKANANINTQATIPVGI